MASDDHASPSTGGEFLLQLLQNRHSNSSITTNSGSTSNSSSTDFSVDLSDHPHLDPAVKVIGPSLTIQRPNPSLLDPYAQNHQFTRNNISSSPPLLPRRFGTNPWPMYGIPVTDSTDSRNSQFPKNRPLVGVDFQKLEFLQGALSSDGLSNVQEGNQNPREQGGFSVRYPLKFGSFNEEVLSGVSLESRSKSKEHDVSREGRGIRTGINSYEGLRRGGNVQESKSFMQTGRLEVQAQETCTKEVSNLIGRRNDMCNHAPKLPVDIRMDCTALSTGNDPNSVYLFRESIRNLNGDEVQENLESEIQGIAKAIERNLELTREDDNNRDEMDERIAEILMNAVETDKVNDTGICNSSRSQDSRFNSSRVIQACSNRMWNRKRETQCRGDIQRLNSSFLKIYESLIPLVDEKEKQNQLLASLRKLISKEWPNAQLHVYGSCANSFGVSNSDIDICLAIDNTNENKSDILLKLAEILLSDNLQNVQALTRARVPVVKFKDPVTGISCDICINNILAVVNTKLLRDYSQIDPRLCQLAFIVKHWAKSRGVNETYKGTLSSYAYVLMCIHFLQLRRPAILPCLQEMEATYVVTVGDIKCAYFDDIVRLRNYGAENHECVAKLLWAFFDYWAYRHDYANSVISVRTGRFVSKRSKDWTRRIGNDRHLICIEDPFDISHDLGRVVDKYSIKILREEFVRAAEIMQSYPNPAALLFEPYKSSDTDL